MAVNPQDMFKLYQEFFTTHPTGTPEEFQAFLTNKASEDDNEVSETAKEINNNPNINKQKIKTTSRSLGNAIQKANDARALNTRVSVEYKDGGDNLKSFAGRKLGDGSMIVEDPTSVSGVAIANVRRIPDSVWTKLYAMEQEGIPIKSDEFDDISLQKAASAFPIKKQLDSVNQQLKDLHWTATNDNSLSQLQSLGKNLTSKQKNRLAQLDEKNKKYLALIAQRDELTRNFDESTYYGSKELDEQDSANKRMSNAIKSVENSMDRKFGRIDDQKAFEKEYDRLRGLGGVNFALTKEELDNKIKELKNKGVDFKYKQMLLDRGISEADANAQVEKYISESALRSLKSEKMRAKAKSNVDSASKLQVYGVGLERYHDDTFANSINNVVGKGSHKPAMNINYTKGADKGLCQVTITDANGEVHDFVVPIIGLPGGYEYWKPLKEFKDKYHPIFSVTAPGNQDSKVYAEKVEHLINAFNSGNYINTILPMIGSPLGSDPLKRYFAGYENGKKAYMDGGVFDYGTDFYTNPEKWKNDYEVLVQTADSLGMTYPDALAYLALKTRGDNRQKIDDSITNAVSAYNNAGKIDDSVKDALSETLSTLYDHAENPATRRTVERFNKTLAGNYTDKDWIQLMNFIGDKHNEQYVNKLAATNMNNYARILDGFNNLKLWNDLKSGPFDKYNGYYAQFGNNNAKKVKALMGKDLDRADRIRYLKDLNLDQYIPTGDIKYNPQDANDPNSLSYALDVLNDIYSNPDDFDTDIWNGVANTEISKAADKGKDYATLSRTYKHLLDQIGNRFSRKQIHMEKDDKGNETGNWAVGEPDQNEYPLFKHINEPSHNETFGSILGDVLNARGRARNIALNDAAATKQLIDYINGSRNGMSKKDIIENEDAIIRADNSDEWIPNTEGEAWKNSKDIDRKIDSQLANQLSMQNYNRLINDLVKGAETGNIGRFTYVPTDIKLWKNSKDFRKLIPYDVYKTLGDSPKERYANALNLVYESFMNNKIDPIEDIASLDKGFVDDFDGNQKFIDLNYTGVPSDVSDIPFYKLGNEDYTNARHDTHNIIKKLNDFEANSLIGDSEKGINSIYRSIAQKVINGDILIDKEYLDELKQNNRITDNTYNHLSMMTNPVDAANYLELAYTSIDADTEALRNNTTPVTPPSVRISSEEPTTMNKANIGDILLSAIKNGSFDNVADNINQFYDGDLVELINKLKSESGRKNIGVKSKDAINIINSINAYLNGGKRNEESK